MTEPLYHDCPDDLADDIPDHARAHPGASGIHQKLPRPMIDANKMTLLSLVASIALLGSACNTWIRKGVKNKLRLHYEEGPVTHATAISPMAKGATLTYSATKNNDDEEDVRIVSAEAISDDDLSVVKVDDGRVTIHANEAGRGATMIKTRAETKQGEMIEDIFGLGAYPVYSLTMKNPCNRYGQAAYLVNSDIRLYYKMQTHHAGAMIVVGYGYYPVAFEPKNQARLTASNVNGLLPIRTGPRSGTVEIISKISNDHFAINLVEPSEVNELQIVEDEIFNHERPLMAVGEDVVLQVLPQIGDAVPVCQSDAEMVVDVSTPDHCQVEYGPIEEKMEARSPLYETNVLKIHALADGLCEFKATMPAADGGNGVSLEYTAKIDSALARKLDAKNE